MVMKAAPCWRLACAGLCRSVCKRPVGPSTSRKLREAPSDQGLPGIRDGVSRAIGRISIYRYREGGFGLGHGLLAWGRLNVEVAGLSGRNGVGTDETGGGRQDKVGGYLAKIGIDRLRGGTTPAAGSGRMSSACCTHMPFYESSGHSMRRKPWHVGFELVQWVQRSYPEHLGSRAIICTTR